MQFRLWLERNAHSKEPKDSYAPLSYWLERIEGTLPRPLGDIMAVDMRFEDWPNDEDHSMLLPALAQPLRSASFSGELPDGQYLTYDGSHFDITNQAIKDSIPLPNDWWDYVAGYSDNELVKIPKVVRHSDIGNIKSVA